MSIIMITIEFEIVHEGMTLRDAIMLPDDHDLTDEQIEQIKQKRFADWIALLTTVEGEE